MKIVYICEPNCTIHKSLESLIIKKGGYKLNSIPLIDVACIMVFGNTQISTQVFNLLFRKGIDLVFMSSSGLVKGRVFAEKASNVVLRIAQFNKWNDEAIKINFSKSIINGKINNQKFVLKKYYKYTGDKKLKDTIRIIENNIQCIKYCNDLNKIMGIEGISAKKYFECFSIILKNFTFSKRNRRPAHDPVNALLNLGYAFLNNEISVRLWTYSFDIELGFLHGIRYGRKSLSLDLMEEFRPIYVDDFIIRLLNKKIFRSNDFENSEEGCILNKNALKKFCRLYHENMDNVSGKGVDWRKIFDKQMKNFRQYILTGGEYKPYIKK